ncbi:MAG: hypothetical protein U0939_25870 [Pirellulales bacterium]
MANVDVENHQSLVRGIAVNSWDFANTSLVILGAGFSRAATNDGTPLMKGYFDRLKKDKYPDLYEFVLETGCDQSCRMIEEANIEEVLLTLDQIRASEPRVCKGWMDEWKDKVPLLRRHVGEYTLFRLLDAIRIDSCNWAVNVLASTGFNTTFISMNYDSVAEVILAHRRGTRHCDGGNCPHCKMRQLLEATCNCAIRSDVVGDLWKGALLKPHGSIAWSRCVNPGCCKAECIVAECNFTPVAGKTCSMCRELCDLALVLPTMSKSLSEMPEIATMWQAANRAASEAESILFFGFSLPTSDALFARLIQQSCKSGKVRRVGVIDLQPHEVIGRMRRLVPATCTIEFTELPVPKQGIPDWFQANPNAITC